MPTKKLLKAKGNYVKYHNDGSIWTQGTMGNEQPDGYWGWFRKDGTKMCSGDFENGQQVGEWMTFDNKGII
jgi:antitoxin component YwqK of YwqJK toxin-antitoxin module